jgi:hypothetical protein
MTKTTELRSIPFPPDAQKPCTLGRREDPCCLAGSIVLTREWMPFFCFTSLHITEVGRDVHLAFVCQGLCYIPGTEKWKYLVSKLSLFSVSNILYCVKKQPKIFMGWSSDLVFLKIVWVSWAHQTVLCSMWYELKPLTCLLSPGSLASASKMASLACLAVGAGCLLGGVCFPPMTSTLGLSLCELTSRIHLDFCTWLLLPM